MLAWCYFYSASKFLTSPLAILPIMAGMLKKCRKLLNGDAVQFNFSYNISYGDADIVMLNFTAVV